jgi:hypothetical protein
VPYSEESAVLIGLRGICFMGMCLIGTHLTGRVSHRHALHGHASHGQDCAESRYQRTLDNRRVGHGENECLGEMGAELGVVCGRFLLLRTHARRPTQLTLKKGPHLGSLALPYSSSPFVLISVSRNDLKEPNLRKAPNLFWKKWPLPLRLSRFPSAEHST